MQDDYLACCIADGIKDGKRITHNWQNSHCRFIGLMSKARKISKQPSKLLYTIDDVAGRRLTSLVNVKKYSVEFGKRGLRPANVHAR